MFEPNFILKQAIISTLKKKITIIFTIINITTCYKSNIIFTVTHFYQQFNTNHNVSTQQL